MVRSDPCVGAGAIYITSVRRMGESILSGKPRIRISTIHKAKGGEADNVLLLLESSPVITRADDTEGEIRTFYVGMTRARKDTTHIVRVTQLTTGLNYEKQRALLGLKQAEELINGPRAEDYGPALLNHERIATIWNVLLRKKLLDKITPTEVTAMMIGLKLARLAEDMHKDDSWVDIIGYAALGGEISNDES